MGCSKGEQGNDPRSPAEMGIGAAGGGVVSVFRWWGMIRHCGNEAPSRGNGMDRQANPAEPQ